MRIVVANSEKLHRLFNVVCKRESNKLAIYDILTAGCFTMVTVCRFCGESVARIGEKFGEKRGGGCGIKKIFILLR